MIMCVLNFLFSFAMIGGNENRKLNGLGLQTTLSSTALSINIYKLHRLLLSSPSSSSPSQSQLDIETELVIVKKYLTAYFAALPLGKHLPKTELQPADDLAVLAAQGLVSAWRLSGEWMGIFSLFP